MNPAAARSNVLTDPAKKVRIGRAGRPRQDGAA